jgi:hypothetical protein
MLGSTGFRIADIRPDLNPGVPEHEQRMPVTASGEVSGRTALQQHASDSELRSIGVECITTACQKYQVSRKSVKYCLKYCL